MLNVLLLAIGLADPYGGHGIGWSILSTYFLLPINVVALHLIFLFGDNKTFVYSLVATAPWVIAHFAVG